MRPEPTMALPESRPPPLPPPGDRCQIADLAGARLQIRLRGALAADWAGRLAAALAAQRISVIRLDGQRQGERLWEVELVVEPLDGSPDPRSLDFLALARGGHGPAGPTVESLPLDLFTLTRTGEALEVDVEAADALGFLDRILRVFAQYDLYPRSLRVETRGKKLHDVFSLVGRSGLSPPLQLCEAVALKLRDLAAPEPP
jgi:hypothetical protein